MKTFNVENKYVIKMHGASNQVFVTEKSKDSKLRLKKLAIFLGGTPRIIDPLLSVFYESVPSIHG